MTKRSRNFFTQQATIGFLTLAAFTVAPFFSGQLAAADVDILSTFGTNNVEIAGEFAYAAAGPAGIVIVDLTMLEIANVVSPPAGAGSVDDISIDGDLLFTMDGFGPGSLSVLSIADPMDPILVSGPVSVAVGPFSGVSAASGRVVVSGGTGLLSTRSYDQTGNLFGATSLIDLGIGQPDVLVAEDGNTAFVSTDFAGFVNGQGFGITVIDISGTPTTVTDQIGIAGAGFSPGGAGPANFPIESAQQGDMLFVASGSGVAVYNVSNPNVVQTLALIPLSTNPVNIDVFNDTVYVVGNSPSSTLTMIDVSNLSSPVINTMSLPAAGTPRSVSASSTHVVIADDNLGVLVETLFVLGDLNGDGAVNLLDVAPFVDLLADGGFQPAGDINGDGAVNLLDVTPFVNLLSG